MGKFFGTDGVRGVANVELTPELALRIGRASALVLGKEDRKPIVVGRDPRLSGQMLEARWWLGWPQPGLMQCLLE